MRRNSLLCLLTGASLVFGAACGSISSGDDDDSADAGSPTFDASGDDFDADNNTSPVVDAGADTDVVVAATAALSGTAMDPDGDSLTYQWTQLSGPAVTIAAPTSLVTDFSATVTFGNSLVFELEACDASTCATDTVAFYVVRTTVLSTYVAPPPLGDDGTGDGSRTAPWATIGQGVTAGAAMTGGGQPVQVRVAEGDYADSITMVDDVSIVGGFDTDWIRDLQSSVTRLQSTASEGVLYEAGGGYAGTTELDGLSLELDSSVTSAGQTAITVREGAGVLRNSAVTLPSVSVLSNGLTVQPLGSAASFTVDTVSFGGGAVSDAAGQISAIVVDGSAATTAVTAVRVSVDLPMPQQRTCFAIRIDDASFDISDSTVVVQDVVASDVITPDLAAGLFGSGISAVTIDNTGIDVGGGFATMAAVVANGTGTLDVTGSNLIGGDVAGGADVALFSYGLFAGAGQSVTLSETTIVGGTVPPSSTPGLHTSEALVINGDLVADDCDIDAGPGDWGFGVWLIDVNSAVITNTRINQGTGGVDCTSADTCVGLIVQGFGGTLAAGQAAPQAPEYSCCDPAHFGIVIEDSQVRGGNGHDSFAFIVQDNSAMVTPTATVCARGSVFDAGDCSPADATASCVGVAFVSGQRFALLNNVVYGGVGGGFSIGAQIMPGGTEPVVSNNYIHGGDPSISGATTVGLFLGNGRTASGSRVLNNIIDGGTGDTRFAAFEENHNSDPGRFQNNDLVVMGLPSVIPPVGAGFYSNCTPVTCGLVYTNIATVNTQLNTAGQGTFGQGGCITDASCMVDPAPRGGDYTHVSGSSCVDAGLDRNISCNICQTPWTDMVGNHRLSTGYSGMTCSSTGASLSGDDVPDLGPMEQ